MAKHIDRTMAEKFVCPKCEHHGADVDRLAMSGTGLSRLFEVQHHRFMFVSCQNCGYTEVYNLKTLEGKDDLGTLVDILFAN